ncbi:MAG: right-handed parallel beta-helix repeat-containing protein [Pontiella sp.]
MTGSVLAARYYVDSNAQGKAPSGESWDTAFPTIQMALDTATTNGGGQVWIRAGVYRPEGISKSATFELTPGISLYGGFRGGETLLEQRNHKANRTVLSGDIGRIGTSSDNSYHVITTSGDSTIDGFIISQGNANSISENRLGGGMHILPGSKNLFIANCTFEKNNAELGGGLYLKDAALTISNVTFYSNSGDLGGAIAIEGNSTLTIQDSIFTSNFAPQGGGALSIGEGGRVRISRTSFLYNSTDGTGGALQAQAHKESGIHLELHHCTFTENSARENGGATFFSGPFPAVVQSCRFEKNFSIRGAGAMANLGGTTLVLLESTFDSNKSPKGIEAIRFDGSSSVVKSKAEAEQLALNHKTGFQSLESEVETPAVKKRQLPDAFVYLAKDHSKLKLHELASDSVYTVFVLGDLTDKEFIKSYRHIEAAARDFYPKGIRFYYIYRHLKYPENNGYIRPFLLKERARHAQVAQEQLQTSVPWVYDGLDNQAAKALAKESEANVFIFSKSGEETYQGALSEPGLFRDMLIQLAGAVEQPYNLETLPTSLMQPQKMAAIKFVVRPQVSVSTDQFKPLLISPKESSNPFYVKARVEASETLLATGNGKLYLGFHIDPLYRVEWNNLSAPLKYMIKTPQGVVAPSIHSAARVSATATDSEPREFILQARQLNLDKPLLLQVTYSIHTTAKRNIEVVQQYTIDLKIDAFGGNVIGRQISVKNSVSAKERRIAQHNAFKSLLRRYDIDRNGKLTKDEVIGSLRSNFEEIDSNGDGAITESEYTAYLNKK